MGPENPELDNDDLVAVLKQRVANRRSNGDYPPGLEEQLEAEFAAIMKAVHRHEFDSTLLEHRVNAFDHATRAIGSGVPEARSRIPGGRLLHRLAGKFVRRHISHLAEEVRRSNETATAALDEIRAMFALQRSVDERQMLEVIGALMDRMAVVDHLADAVIELERRAAFQEELSLE